MTAGTRSRSKPEPMHRWHGAGGLSIAGDSWGDPDGPLVVLLHGVGQTRHAWKGVAQFLGVAGYHAVAFDARGHGDSDWDPNGLYTREVMVQDLVRVLAALGKHSPALVGASMGGDICMLAAGEGHIEAAAVVLVDVAPRVEVAGVDTVQGFLHDNRRGFGSLEEVAESIARYQQNRSRPRNLEGLAKYLRTGDDGRYYWHWDPKHFEAEPDLELRQAQLEAAARRLRAPALLVRGALSDMLSDECVQDFLRVCPHAEYVNVTGAAHMAAGDRNDVFAGAVIDFLSRCIPG